MWDDDVAGTGASVSPFNENIYIHCLSHSALCTGPESRQGASLSSLRTSSSRRAYLDVRAFGIADWVRAQRWVLTPLLLRTVKKGGRERKKTDGGVFIAQMQTIQQLTFKATWLQWLLPPYMKTLHTFCFPGCADKVSVWRTGKL